MSDMMLEIKLLGLLNEQPKLRSAQLGKMLETPGRTVLGVLRALEKQGHVQDNSNGQWSLLAPGKRFLVELENLLEPQNADVKKPTDDEGTRQEIINKPVDARLLVTAGPGMGKTHIACERIHTLIDQGTPPEKILVISFSRMAVHIMRTRALGPLAGVHVRTLDSLGVYLHGEAIQGEDYDASIERAIETCKQWAPQLRHQYEHVVIDEAQDIVDVRARLVMCVLEQLISSGSGFTVFADPAQAIYDYTSKQHHMDDSLPEQLECVENLCTCELQKVYRTGNPELLGLMEMSRTLVLSSNLEQLKKLIKSHITQIDETEDIHDELWLYRSRHEVIDAIVRASKYDVPVNLLMSGAVIPLDPQLVSIFEQCSWPYIVRPDLQNIESLSPCRADELFIAMRDMAAISKDRVDLRKVVARLACTHKIPQQMATPKNKECITLGVIHAAKGAQARCVRYFYRTSSRLSQEEARVIHVAISRARQKMFIHRTSAYNKTRNIRGREWLSRGSLQILIHGMEDVDPYYGLGIFVGEDCSVQARLQKFTGAPQALTARFDGSRYLLYLKETDEPVGALSKKVLKDIEARFGDHFKSHHEMAGLYILGVSAHASDPGHIPTAPLRSPYHKTSMWLVPIVAGFGRPYLPEENT